MGQSAQDSERRQYRRYKRRLTLRFTADGKHWSSAYTADVGPRGLFVVCQNRLSAHRHVRLEVDIPRSSGSLTLTGTVVWSHQALGRLVSVQKGGFAVRLDGAPEEWFAFCAEHETSSSRSAAPS